MKRILFPIIGLVLLIVTVTQVSAMRNARNATQNPAGTAPQPAHITAEGRLVAYPDSEVTVGSDAEGTVQQLRVREKDSVRKGDVIAIIKADDTRAALAESRARVGEADADIRLFEMERSRAKHLFETEVGSKQAWEKADRDLDAARARRSSAVAEVERLEAMVKKTVVTAPIDGSVVTRFVDSGERISEGQPLVTIANLTRTRVEAEVDEFDAARVRLGSAVTVKAEGFNETWRGRVEEIPDSVVSRRLNPQDPSKPIDTRVLLVKIALEEPAPVKLGQRVEVLIGSNQ
jgi:RND family efflux transporter MFP subunit